MFFYLWKSTALSEDSTQILKALYKLCPLLIPLYIVYIYYVYGNLRSHDPLLCCINLLFYSFPPPPSPGCNVGIAVERDGGTKGVTIITIITGMVAALLHLRSRLTAFRIVPHDKSHHLGYFFHLKDHVTKWHTSVYLYFFIQSLGLFLVLFW